MQPASHNLEEEEADQEEEEARQFGRALEGWHEQVAGAAAEATKRITIRALKSVEKLILPECRGSAVLDW
jgi:hypothetical protein